MPTFAFVNGAAMGGGLELGAALPLPHHLVGRARAGAARGLPRPGPGWGGSQLLPNLIGAETAVTVIVENALNQNRMLKGPQAFELGIADAMFEPADFLEQSLRLGRRRAARRRSPSTGPRSTAATAWDGALARGKAIADMQGARRGAGAVQGARLHRAAAHGVVRRGLRRRGRRRSPTWSSATSCAPASTPSTWCRARQEARPVRPTSRWPATSPRSASSAPV